MEDDVNITGLLHAWRDGDDTALERLSPFVYQELKRLSRKYMAGEPEGHTLQPTALVNEAFIRLIDSDIDYQSRKHFYVIAARIMRRVLVDYARSKGRKKRGEGALAITLVEDSALATDEASDMPILVLDEALSKLHEIDQRAANAIEIVYFGGLSPEDAADVLDISRTALFGDLRFARAWLKRAMS